MSSATVIDREKATTVSPADNVTADGLWLTLPDLKAATGWEVKPEGVCREAICVPVPDVRRGHLLRGDGGQARLNLAELASLIEQPFAHDDANAAWYFGPPGWEWKSRLTLQQAPDITLPDFEGKLHSLSDYRGKKLFLLAWASW